MAHDYARTVHGPDRPPAPDGALDRCLPRGEAKRDVERYWLRYTLLWGGACAAVMLTGVAERWTDRELMPFGVLLGLGAVVPPAMFPRSAAERRRTLARRTATRMGLVVIAFAFGMNLLCTQYFYDVLHMHYGFHSALLIRRNPLFLHFLTVAYFATYATLLLRADRFSRILGARAPRPLSKVPTLLAPFVVAGLETALNANPFMKRLFCYDDLGFALSFGTLSYGACFCFMLPVWRGIDEEEEDGAERPSGVALLVRVALALAAMAVTFALLRHFVAPHLTRVVDGSPGVGWAPGTCLER